MKIMFSAGEASGDLHGANLARSLRELDPQIELLGMGGKEMAAAGVDIVYDIKNLGVIGVGEIIRKIPFFFRLRDFLVDTMRKEKPDVLVCIDYPGFNMRLIKVAKAAGIPVVYYILPTIWAWHKSRGKTIAKYTDLAISLFPFEAKMYEDMGTNVIYAGHPLVDTVHEPPRGLCSFRTGRTEEDGPPHAGQPGPGSTRPPAVYAGSGQAHPQRGRGRPVHPAQGVDYRRRPPR